MPRRGLEPPRDFTPTSTSSWRVCQFRHLGDAVESIRMARRASSRPAYAAVVRVRVLRSLARQGPGLSTSLERRRCMRSPPGPVRAQDRGTRVPDHGSCTHDRTGAHVSRTTGVARRTGPGHACAGLRELHAGQDGAHGVPDDGSPGPKGVPGPRARDHGSSEPREPGVLRSKARQGPGRVRGSKIVVACAPHPALSEHRTGAHVSPTTGVAHAPDHGSSTCAENAKIPRRAQLVEPRMLGPRGGKRPPGGHWTRRRSVALFT